MQTIIDLEKFLALHRADLIEVIRPDGTSIISNLIIEFARKNNLRIKAEVPVRFDVTMKGKLDFLITNGKTLYPIEIDFIHKKRSYRKLLAFINRDDCKPIWIRWNRISHKDENIEGIHIIDLSTKPPIKDKSSIKELTPDDVFSFGIYLGKSLREIIRQNPAYVRWCLDNLYTFKVSNEALDLLQKSEEIKKKSL